MFFTPLPVETLAVEAVDDVAIVVAEKLPMGEAEIGRNRGIRLLSPPSDLEATF
jgi:hypothetical protein